MKKFETPAIEVLEIVTENITNADLGVDEGSTGEGLGD